MHVEQKTGHVPGTIYATIRHGTTHQTIRVDVERTNSGRFVARMPDHRWSPECATIDNAILLHASVAFPVEVETSPWLSNPKPIFPAVSLHPRRVNTPKPAEATAGDVEAPCVSLERV